MGNWIVPYPVAGALFGAAAALAFALFKSFLDRRQALAETVSMLDAELQNVERHCKDSWAILRGVSRSDYAKEKIEMAQFPSGGLVTLSIKDLLGLPPMLIQDLMTMVIYLRNTNIMSENAKVEPSRERLATISDALLARLDISQRRARGIRVAMRRRWLTGGASYPDERQWPTITSAPAEIAPKT